MANRSEVGAGGLLVAFAAGALVGAAVALLFTPATGEDARDFLAQRAREGRDRAAEAARRGREFYERQRQQVTTAFERAREQARAAREDGDEGA